MRHTLGPWHVRFAPNLTAIQTPKGEIQLSLHGIYDGLKPLSVDLQEWQSNAHLIAAAPALYEAVKEALGFIETQYLVLHYPGRCVTEPPIISQLKAAMSSVR